MRSYRDTLPPAIKRPLAIAELWFDLAERFLSACWRYLDAQHAAPREFDYGGVRRHVAPGFSLLLPDFKLGPDAFPSPDHWHVAQALAEIAEHGLRPRNSLVRQRAMHAGATLTTVCGWDDLVDQIDRAENSYAGVAAFARRLEDFGRRNRIGLLLRRVGDALLDPDIPSETIRRNLRERLAAPGDAA